MVEVRVCDSEAKPLNTVLLGCFESLSGGSQAPCHEYPKKQWLPVNNHYQLSTQVDEPPSKWILQPQSNPQITVTLANILPAAS